MSKIASSTSRHARRTAVPAAALLAIEEQVTGLEISQRGRDLSVAAANKAVDKPSTASFGENGLPAPLPVAIGLTPDAPNLVVGVQPAYTF